MGEPRTSTLDMERLRIERGWPTPNHMRHAADALDMLLYPRYGDVLRWVADRCDADPFDEEAAVELLVEAIPFMEDEWEGTEGPIGEGGKWLMKARSFLDEAEPARQHGEPR
jgi:hypothetical protein